MGIVNRYCHLNQVIRRSLLHGKLRLTLVFTKWQVQVCDCSRVNSERLRQYISLLPLRKHPGRYGQLFSAAFSILEHDRKNHKYLSNF